MMRTRFFAGCDLGLVLQPIRLVFHGSCLLRAAAGKGAPEQDQYTALLNSRRLRYKFC
jgi:hypothetical protein